MKGVVTNIQRYSIHDGPGIRTVVFFKGCPLSCLWCCNPETQSFNPEVEFIISLCQQCGKCVRLCPRQAINVDLFCEENQKIDRKLCTVCGDCVSVCPNDALKMTGEKWNVKDIVELISKDMAFYRRSGGGVTLSGGEPLSQPKFAYQILRECYKLNIHTAIETCGFAAQEHYKKILSFTNLFLFDIKHLDKNIHRKLTGVTNENILKNLFWLATQHANIILRLPLIPEMNMEDEEVIEIAKLALDLKINEIHLMPFHQMGKDKYRYLGRNYLLSEKKDLRLLPCGKQVIQKVENLLVQKGINVFIGG